MSELRQLRGGRCFSCRVVWCWKASGAAPVHGSHCPRCGDVLRQTNVRQVTRIQIKAGFPWYSMRSAPTRGQTRRRYQVSVAAVKRYARRYGLRRLGEIGRAPGYWFTFDAGPGNDTAQEGRRLVRQWAPVDLAAPEWLEGLDRDA